MATLQGLMQDTPLVVSGLLDYAVRVHGDREIVSRTVEDPSVVHRSLLAMQDRTSSHLRSTGLTLFSEMYSSFVHPA